MNLREWDWHKIGWHIFLSPLYVLGIAAFCYFFYELYRGIIWLFEDWKHIFDLIGSVWAMMLFLFICDKVSSYFDE